VVDHARALEPASGRTVHAPLIYVGGKLASGRMVLEALTPAHAPLMIEGFADPELYRFIDVTAPTDADELERRFRRIANPYAPSGELWLNWAMLLRESGRYVGLIEATVRPDRVVHLAYYVFTAYMRQGLAREACTTIIDHLWHAYDATEIRADSDFRNVPSRCLLESLGFTRRAHTRTTKVHGQASVDYRYRLKRPR
jgi:ribosomal-protein-alanine N-acetyltransferase